MRFVLITWISLICVGMLLAQSGLPVMGSTRQGSGGGGLTYTFNASKSGINAVCVANATTCTVNGLTSAAEGDVVILVIMTKTSSAARTIVSATGNSDPSGLKLCTSSVCNGYDNGSNFDVDIAVFQNSHLGQTSYIVTLNGSTGSVLWAFAVLDFTPSSAGTAVYDVGGNYDFSTTNTSVVAPSMSITGATDLFVQVLYLTTMSGTGVSINGGYSIPTGFQVNPSGTRTGVIAYLTNQTSYTPPTWSWATTGVGALGAIAIK